MLDGFTSCHWPFLSKPLNGDSSKVWTILFAGVCWWALVSPVWGQLDRAEQVQAIEQDIQRLQVLAKSNSNDPHILTKLAGRYLNLGDTIHESQDERILAYENGARLAKAALSIQEDLADAHFFYAANLGSATQLKGVMASALVVRELKSHAERLLNCKKTMHPPCICWAR